MTFLHYLDFISFVAICWTSFAALESGHEVDDWWRAILALSLLGTMASSFMGAIIVVVDAPNFYWFVRGLIYSGTLFALWFYQRRYGIDRHLRMVRDCLLRRFHVPERKVTR